MKMMKLMILAFLILPLATTISSAQNGGGDLKIGYVYIDEDGNRSVSQSSFNIYDGASISVEDFHYRFKNGLRVSSNLRNINLDNRNLAFGVDNPGVFGAEVNSNRFRRIYNFDGSSQTRRDLTSANIWAYPNRYVKIFGDGSFNYVSGKVQDLFWPGLPGYARDIDFRRNKYGVGAIIRYQGRMFQAEFNSISYTDDIDNSKNQSRERVKLFGHFPVPGYEWLVLSGAFQKFGTKYDDTKFELESTIAKGSILANFPYNFSANYVTFFSRAGSDSDFVDTDNLAHLVYLSYNKPGAFGLTGGYQYDVNDDYEDVVTANSYYFSGHIAPASGYELKAVYGMRAEEVDEGERLAGDEDRDRFKVYWEYKGSEFGRLKIGIESRNRKNEQLESEAEFVRYSLETNLRGIEFFTLSGGYSYMEGDYEHSGTNFEFNSHQVHVGVDTKEYKNFTGGAGLTYFRNKRDLDSESVNMQFRGIYTFMGTQRAELVYRVFNFDDFLVLDQYYTENIVELNLIKSFSF